MRRDQKKLLIIGISGGVVLAGVTAGLTSLVYSGKLKSERETSAELLAIKDDQLKRVTLSSKKGVVLTVKKEAGETIKESDIQIGNPPDAFSPLDIIADPKAVVGKTIKINAEKNMPITPSMIYDDGPLDNSTRIVKTDYIRFEDNVKAKDKVDVRILFPTGEDFVVLSKKKLDWTDYANQGLQFLGNEGEILLLDSALVDAYTNSAEIYIAKYADAEMQDAPIVNYIPNLNVMALMKNHPGIVDKAKFRLIEVLRKDLDANLKSLDAQQKIRLGAQLPSGSSVATKKRTTTGVTTNPKPNTGGVNSPTSNTAPVQSNTPNTTPATNTPASSGDSSNGSGLSGGK